MNLDLKNCSQDHQDPYFSSSKPCKESDSIDTSPEGLFHRNEEGLNCFQEALINANEEIILNFAQKIPVDTLAQLIHSPSEENGSRISKKLYDLLDLSDAQLSPVLGLLHQYLGDSLKSSLEDLQKNFGFFTQAIYTGRYSGVLQCLNYAPQLLSLRQNPNSLHASHIP